MIQRPVLKKHYQVYPVPGDGCYLLGARQGRHLRGSVFEDLIPLLDGRMGADEIVQALADRVPPAEVYYALMELEAQGYLIDDSSTAADAESAFWHALDVDTGTARRRIASGRVALQVVGDVDAGALKTDLEALGIVVGDAGEILLALTDHYLRPDLARLNHEALRTGRPWLLANPQGLVPWLGPLFIPGRTACWECLRQRLKANRAAGALLLPDGTVLEGGRPTGPATIRTALGMLTTHLLAWLGTRSGGPLAGTIVTYDAVDLTIQRHVVTRRGQCPACGTPELYARQLDEGVQLVSVPVGFRADGGYRAISPDETLARHRDLVSPITGIVGAIRQVAARNAKHLHVYVADYPAGAGAWGPGPGRGMRREASSGKGATASQAQASALGEAVERYCGTFQGDEPRVHASLNDVGDAAIHPNDCMLFSDAQYRARGTATDSADPHARAPARLDPRLTIDWTPVWSLTRRRLRYLPTMYLYYRYPAEPHSMCCFADSNGSAAGNTVEEAILQGFMELVERDGVALWWYNRLRRPALAVDGTLPPYWAQVRAEYEALGRELWALDLTSDLGIPIFAAISRNRGQTSDEIMLGFGAHFDASIALTRAVTEMSQMWLLASEARQRGYGLGDNVDAWLRDATLAGQPYLAPGPQPGTALQRFPAADYQDLRSAVESCRVRAESRGLEMLLLNQTRPDVNVPVVKVIVPGLRHFWPRLAPGRLYDVPVELGWLPARRLEAELNPLPLPA